MISITAKYDLHKQNAAQSAREGLINVADLSLLTGVVVSQLTKFAKSGSLNHYGEYHGKRFFKFEEVVNWAMEASDDPGRAAVRAGMEAEMQKADCPYYLEISDGAVQIIWKALVSEQAAA